MGSVGSEGACPLSSPPRLSPHKKYLSQRGFLSTHTPNPTARACTQGRARTGMHGAERCKTCCKRGAGGSRPAEIGGHQYLCSFLSPPPPSILVLCYKSPVSQLPGTSVTSYFCPTFPPRLAFWKGRDEARLKHDSATNVGFTQRHFIRCHRCRAFAAHLSACNLECNTASLWRGGE